MQVVPLTVLPGHEQWPTFSPDGDQVAFEWDGENGDNADIYITMVGSSELRRLTTNPARRPGAELVARRPADRVRPRHRRVEAAASIWSRRWADPTGR